MPPEPLKIGVLFSQSGLLDVSEQAHLRGVLLACADINGRGGVEGRMLEPVILDPKGDDRRYAELATELILNHRTNAIFGCCLSSSRKAVLPVIERFNGVLFYPSVYEGFEYSPNVIYGGAVPNQIVLPLLEYLFAHHGRKIALIGSDTFYAREINRIVKEFLAGSGGQVVSERYIPFNATPDDFRIASRSLAAEGADAILSTLVGRHSIAYYEAYAQEVPGPNRPPIASLTTTESELAEMRPEARTGHLAVAPYFGSIETPQNEGFVASYSARYGAGLPGVYTAVTWSLVQFFANAVALSGGSDTGSLLSALAGAVYKAPQGDLHIDADTNHIDMRPLIGQSTPQGTYRIVWQSPAILRADPYLVAYDRSVRSSLPA